MHGVRSSILRAGIISLTLFSTAGFAEAVNPPPGAPTGSEHLRREALEIIDSAVRRAAEASKPSPAQSELAAKITKIRKELIDNLAKAATPEAKETAAIELRKALGSEDEGKTLKPQTLSDIVEGLKKADTTAKKEKWAKDLLNSLSVSGKGEDLTGDILKGEVDKLKKAASAEEREKAAKGVLKALGPDGVHLFKKDGKIDFQKMADVLGFDKEKEKEQSKALADEQAKADKELGLGKTSGAAASTAPPAPPEAGPKVPLDATPIRDGNGAQAQNPDPNGLSKIDNGPNLDATNPAVNGGADNVFNPGDLNQDQLADANQDEIDRLNELNDLQRQLDQEKLNRALDQAENEKNQGDRVNAPTKTENPPQPISPPSISAPSGGGGEGKGEPPPPGEPMIPPQFPPFPQPPPPPPDNTAVLLEMFKGLNKGGEQNSDKEWMTKMFMEIQAMGGQNLTTLMATISTIGQTMMGAVKPVAPQLAVARRNVIPRPGGAMPNLYGNQPKGNRPPQNGGPRSTPKVTGEVPRIARSSKTVPAALASRTKTTSKVSSSEGLRGPLSRAATKRRNARAIR